MLKSHGVQDPWLRGGRDPAYVSSDTCYYSGSGKREPDHEGGEGRAATGRSGSASMNPRVAILKQLCGRRESSPRRGRKRERAAVDARRSAAHRRWHS